MEPERAMQIARALLKRIPEDRGPRRCRDRDGIVYAIRRTGQYAGGNSLSDAPRRFIAKDCILAVTVGNWILTRRFRSGMRTERFLACAAWMAGQAQVELARQAALPLAA